MIEKIKGRHPDSASSWAWRVSTCPTARRACLQGQALAGTWSKDQVKVAQEAGATIFGPA